MCSRFGFEPALRCDGIWVCELLGDGQKPLIFVRMPQIVQEFKHCYLLGWVAVCCDYVYACIMEKNSDIEKRYTTI